MRDMLSRLASKTIFYDNKYIPYNFYDYKIIQFYYDSQFDCGRKSEYLGKNTDILYICKTLTSFINFDGISSEI
jgi:hypothetical protein